MIREKESERKRQHASGKREEEGRKHSHENTYLMTPENQNLRFSLNLKEIKRKTNVEMVCVWA